MADWFAVRTRPNTEGRATIAIGGIGLTSYLPIELIRQKYRDSGYEVSWRPLFVGYLFAQFDPARDIPRILEIEGVAEILRAGGRPAPINHAVIEAIRTAEHCGAFDRARARLAVGDEVRVPVGPVANLIARIRSAKPRRRAELVGEFAFRISAPVDKLVKVTAWKMK